MAEISVSEEFANEELALRYQNWKLEPMWRLNEP